jgi:hypothetical protein
MLRSAWLNSAASGSSSPEGYTYAAASVSVLVVPAASRTTALPAASTSSGALLELVSEAPFRITFTVADGALTITWPLLSEPVSR